MDISPDALDFIINHIVLPPKLPQADDSNPKNELALIKFALDQAVAFQNGVSTESRPCWAGIVKMLTTWQEVNSHGSIEENALLRATTALHLNESIALHIRCQNAGLVLRKVADGVIFECFEASPLADAVMGSKASLRRSFPGRAIQLPAETFNDPKFVAELTFFLHRLDSEQVDKVKAKTTKAKSKVVEERDSSSPVLVTELLFAILAPYGKIIKSRCITKRVRDDVCWNDAELPWRRSPVWLVFKVAIELCLVNSGLDNAAFHYKNYMILLLATLSQAARMHRSSSELLFVINAKAARRASKLGSGMFGFVERFALDSVELTKNKIEQHVLATQKADSLQTETIITSLNDTILRLTTSKPYLTEAVGRKLTPVGSEKFSPPAPFRLSCSSGGLPLPDSLSVSEQSSMLVLADFETWVRDDLKQWLQISDDTNVEWADICENLNNSHSSQECQTLKELISKYESAATRLYKPHPEYLSLMLLTIMELWCALDIIVVRLYPLLKSYSPEVPTTILQPLLLPRREQLVRLQQIETYLGKRHQQVILSFPSVFGKINSESLSVQYFNFCKELQDLRIQIERDAAEDKESKRQELERLTASHNSLVEKASRREHLWRIDRRGHQYHDQTCLKCRIEREANNIHISIYEWPLPDSEAEAKAAVFELRCPRAIATWRDVTFNIIHDLGRPVSLKSESVQERVLDYQSLRRYHSTEGQRISMGSTTKSFLRAHYSSRRVPVELQQLTVNNGLRYQVLDTWNDIWTVHQTQAPTLDAWCVSKLSAETHSNLQWTVDSTRHTQNELLAAQTSCSINLTIHEFLAFGSLRAGERLQWYNILRELGSADLHLNSEAVGTLLTQAAWQAGSALPNSDLRESHVVFKDLEFCTRMHEVLVCAFEKIEANWKELDSMNLLVILSLRLLSLVKNRSMITKCLRLLARFREVTLRWTHELAQNMRQSGESDQSQQRLLKAALTCRMTYSVDSPFVDSVLESGTDIATFVECSIQVHDSCPDDATQLPLPLRQALLRDQRLAHFVEPKLAQLIRDGSSGVTEGIKRIWQGAYLPDIWKFVPEPLEQWVVTTTAPLRGTLPQSVHYNLFSGKLLVDGRRLGRLPAEYTAHPLYRRIFGTSILDVVAADETGMSYRTTRLMFGYKVYFGFANGTFLIRIKNEYRHLEAVPSHIFKGDLPADFVSDFIHWLDLDTGVVEFRTVAELWLSSSEQWRLTFKQKPYRLLQNQRSLVDPSSSTCVQINKILNPTESKEFIHVILSNDSKFQVDLPRFRLRFLVNEAGRLECPELGTIVDQDQNIGTLFGLKNKLVMQGLGNRSIKARRSVLVPYGTISTELSPNGTNVHITTGSGRPIRYFSYQLDQRLRQLRSGSDLESHFYKAYLHSVTSLLLPDPFIGRTGTEEAFSCLEETGAYSSAPLSDDVVKVLDWIAGLTPEREFYPSHLRCMQKARWNNNLSSLVQHARFCKMAEGIVRHSNRFTGLHEVETVPRLKSRGSEYLQERSLHRNSPFYRHAVQNTTCPQAEDCDYRSRDRDNNSRAAQQAFEVAHVIKEWPSKMRLECDIYSCLKKWPTVDGFGQSFTTTSLTELLDIPMSKHWGSLYTHCRNSRRSDTLSLTFLFCILSYGKEAPSLELRSLLAFAFTDLSCLPTMPPSGTYAISQGHELQHQVVREIIEQCVHEFENADSQVSMSEQQEERVALYKLEVEQQSDHIYQKIRRQWPQYESPSLRQSDAPRLDIAAVTDRVGGRFKNWYRNYVLFRHFEEVKPILQEMNDAFPTVQNLGDYRLGWDPCRWSARENPIPSLSQLLDRLDCPIISSDKSLQQTGMEKAPDNKEFCFAELEDIISRFSSKKDETRITYGNELLASFQALKPTLADSLEYQNLSCALDVYQREIEQHENLFFQRILKKLQPERGKSAELLLSMGGLWPCVTPRVLLSRLSHLHISTLQESWKRALLAYGDAITEHQRANRLLTFVELGNQVALRKEMSNKKNDGWSPNERPDWRLLEIENDFLIRPIQARVANEMIAPSSKNNNFVMQLNMGEGKSSVIIPMLACALADGSQLTRCVVLKPLARGMEHLLTRRLGGLVARRVYYAPFSRKTLLTSEVASHLEEIYHECKDARGILLIQPEHILSFKLMGIDRLFSKDFDLAIPMMNIQSWLEKNSRDILDESDELLNVNFELAYTIGSQMMLDGQPARWTVAQSLLSLTAKHAASLHDVYPMGIEWNSRGQGSFPTCRILDSTVGDSLMAKLTADILDGHVSGLSFDHCDIVIRSAVQEFIADRALSPKTIRCITENFDDTVQLQTLFLLRGLIGHGILRFTLERKRWLVNYGLDLQRCLMAVPYRAKSTPSLSAEFAHPDVAIILTCLSYYYTGLTDSQLRTCFQFLGRLTDPSLEYQKWQQHSGLPPKLRNFSGINLDDGNQWDDELSPHLRLNKFVIDFFLSRVVFPKEGKGFPHKLSTSAWDLPANRDYSLTTGFSGTNDNRLLLPLNIQQQDLGELKHTSAMVLITLLRKENREYVCSSDEKGQRLSVVQFLQLLVLKQPPIRVLLDVGAQVLEIENQHVIKEWLHLASADVKAGVFFDANDELMVLDREGKLERLIASSFRERLGECVVYLDEAHTRGTDLPFPINYRAAVTLGPEITKDRFVQACMRMRNLGHGQSIMCFAPPEVNNSILKLVQKPASQIDISYVIEWTLEQTCRHIDQERALWASRGLNYTKRRLAKDRLLLDAGSEDSEKIVHCDGVGGFLDRVKDRETLSLQEMYFDSKDKAADLPYGFQDDLDDSTAQKIISVWRKLDNATQQASPLQEEQEREVAHEIEQERQVQRPRKIEPRKHSVHEVIRTFVRNGWLPSKRTGFEPVFESLKHTTAKTSYIPQLEAPVFASDDFIHAVKTEPYDDYIRPVNWVLVGKGGAFVDVLLLSPYEANELLPAIRQSENVNLHIYAPRTSKSMYSFGRLDFLSTNPHHYSFPAPKTLSTLNLFAGMSYFDSLQEYQEFCNFCGLIGGTAAGSVSHTHVSSEGFVHPAGRSVGWVSVFQKSPLPLIKALLGMRRKGDDWTMTHVGRIVDLKVLKEGDF